MQHYYFVEESDRPPLKYEINIFSYGCTDGRKERKFLARFKHGIGGLGKNGSLAFPWSFYFGTFSLTYKNIFWTASFKCWRVAKGEGQKFV
jgi:hypothetical protein